jgi:hypothetical protein
MMTPTIELPEEERATALQLGWVAVDPEGGAFMFKIRSTLGRPPKYVIIQPNKSVEERGGLFAPHQYDYPHGRKLVRAWTDEEAIASANGKLHTMAGGAA